jgi:hypothetical protein
MNLEQDNKEFHTDALVLLQKMFNEFLFIKNCFEIDDKGMNIDKEAFELKPSIFYALDSLLSLK